MAGWSTAQHAAKHSQEPATAVQQAACTYHRSKGVTVQAAHRGKEPPGAPRQQAAQLHGRGEVNQIVVVAGHAAQAQVTAAVHQRPALIVHGPGSTVAVSADRVPLTQLVARLQAYLPPPPASAPRSTYTGLAVCEDHAGASFALELQGLSASTRKICWGAPRKTPERAVGKGMHRTGCQDAKPGCSASKVAVHAERDDGVNCLQV